MQFIRRLLRAPAFHIVLLTLLLGMVFLRTQISPQDDHFHYQKFIETLASGRLDLSIPGFQGASFLALPLYLLTHSPLTNIYVQLLCALLLPLAGYAAAQALLKDRFQAVLFSYVIALSPYLTFIAFRGFTFPSFTLLILLTLWLRARGSAWAFLPWAFSVITKPFSIALFPLFLLWHPSRTNDANRHAQGWWVRFAFWKRSSRVSWWSKGWVQILFALPIPVLYVALQYAQVGHVIVGSHANLDQSNVFLWWRMPLNAAHGLQMMFSVHNYYFPDPGKTGPGNIMHTSPLLVAFGVFALLYPRENWKDICLARAIALTALIAFSLAAALDHMDHFYMETSVLLLTLASLPFVARHRLLLPLVLALFHLSFFYIWLWGRGTYFMDYSIFFVPFMVDILALLSWMLLGMPRSMAEWKRILRDLGWLGASA